MPCNHLPAPFARVFNATVVMNPGSNEGAMYPQARENIDMRSYPIGWRRENFLADQHWSSAEATKRPLPSPLQPKRAQAVRRFFQPVTAITNLTNSSTNENFGNNSAFSHYRIDLGREVLIIFAVVRSLHSNGLKIYFTFMLVHLFIRHILHTSTVIYT